MNYIELFDQLSETMPVGEAVEKVVLQAQQDMPPYPAQPARPRLNVMSPSPSEVREYAARLERYEVDVEAFKAQKEAYRLADNARYTSIKKVMQHAVGCFSEAVWKKAWADGHSSGYNEVMEVYWHLVELADLIHEINKENELR